MSCVYAVTGSDTTTANTTQAGITGGTTVRPAIFELIVGSVAGPADQATEYYIQRSTAAGTSTAFTPVPLDSANPASITTAGVNHSVEPTYTASAIPLRFAVNQRATYRWVAYNERSRIVVPATASNGLGLLAAATSSAYAAAFTILFEE